VKQRKAIQLAIAAGTATLLLALLQLQAQSVDALLDKLVDKGILTVKEANELREETDKNFLTALQARNGMPDWVTSLKFNGDLRGRYEGFFADNPAFVDRNRFRYRLRAGFTATMLNDFETGFRLGSGDLDSANKITSGIDPISNNQTFQNNASKKGVFLDLAYMKWSPIHRLGWGGVFTIGKMENPFVFSDLVFDADYTPEGAAQQFSYQVTAKHELKLNVGEFVLDELSASSSDPWLLGAQVRLDSAWNAKWLTSLGASILSIQNAAQLASSAVPDIDTGNTRYATRGTDGRTYTLGAPVYPFNPFVLDASVTHMLESAPLYNGAFPIRVFGEYINNPAASESDNDGWQVGVTLGKAGKRKTGELTYRYKYLSGDAWWEELVDSDSGAFYQNAGPASPAPPAAILRAPGAGYGAGTNIRGHVVRAGCSPFDHVTLNLTWFGLELIRPYQPGSDSFMNRLQADVSLKF
jgi:hypothetical protein